MGKQYDSISDKHREFIEAQKMFFVGTAAKDGRVNISPKGMDTLRVINEKKIVWLNLTGSGNETAAHILDSNRITIMLCAFEGDPKIMRIYGSAKVVHPRDEAWNERISLFPAFEGARQVIEISVDKIGTSCGFGVPLYDFRGQRDNLKQWASKKGESGIREYWEKMNVTSIDGKPTNIFGD